MGLVPNTPTPTKLNKKMWVRNVVRDIWSEIFVWSEMTWEFVEDQDTHEVPPPACPPAPLHYRLLIEFSTNEKILVDNELWNTSLRFLRNHPTLPVCMGNWVGFIHISAPVNVMFRMPAFRWELDLSSYKWAPFSDKRLKPYWWRQLLVPFLNTAPPLTLISKYNKRAIFLFLKDLAISSSSTHNPKQVPLAFIQ